jgi:hypothetical protein
MSDAGFGNLIAVTEVLAWSILRCGNLEDPRLSQAEFATVYLRSRAAGRRLGDWSANTIREVEAAPSVRNSAVRLRPIHPTSDSR